MERLKHSNDIEIKLLANKRFIYANRRQNIVITAEHLATEITVLFPEEYEEYSKRVDFINSQGKEWTEGLYTPEFKNYKPGTHKCRFQFSLPTEVTTEGELKMQFLAYLPDESMTTVPFEIIPIDIQNGMLAFKRSSKSNPDLLILAANQSTQALFNSQKAVAKSENAEKVSQRADEQSKEAVETANLTASQFAAEKAAREQRDAELQASIDAEADRATQAETAITAALTAETERAIAAEQTNVQAIETETQRASAAESVLTAGLAAEVLRASQAEDNLNIALNAETIARIQGDADNKAAIDAETKRAEAAESVLTTDLAAEIARAKLAEQINAGAIVTETDRAKATESDLQSQINAEHTRAANAENNLQSQLTAEVSRAKQSEAGISADLNAEVTRAKTAEQINETAMQAETSRACSGCPANFTIPENEIEVAFNLTIKELLKDETVLNDCMINVAEAIDTGKVKEQLEQFDEELQSHRKRLYELMHVQVNSTHARRQIDDEMQKIMRQSESIQAERDRLITSVERSSLDEMRLEEMKAFISENNPLTDFDKDLFRKLIHHVIVHSRNEIEFFLYMGKNRRVRLNEINK